MMIIKKEKTEELKSGRTNVYIADVVGNTAQHICNVLNGKASCSFQLAKTLVALKKCKQISEISDSEILYYFDKE